MPSERRIVARNTALNLLGYIVPAVAAIFAIPLLIKGMGAERFGILTLAWGVMGYFGMFDLGIGRATTKFVAERSARGEFSALPSLIWNSAALLLLVGLAGGTAAALLTPWLVSSAFNIPSSLIGETRSAFYLVAASLPAMLGAAGTRGVLEGQYRFGAVNLAKAAGGVFLFAGPLVVLPFSDNLAHITAVLVASRYVLFFVFIYMCGRSVEGIRRPRRIRGSVIKELLGFGGWLTATNVVGSLMSFGYIDRFLISSMLSVGAVAYYVTPFELVTKLWFFPVSLTAVMFPLLSAYNAAQKDRLLVAHDKALRYMMVAFTPVCAAFIVFAEPFLEVWVGKEFAAQGGWVMRILTVGVYFISLAQVPYVTIQAVGRPDLTAKRHMLELPFYLAGMWYLTSRLGIVGAALAWLAWTVVDTALLFEIMRRLFPSGRKVGLLDNRSDSRAGSPVLLLGSCAALLMALPLSALSGVFLKIIFLALIIIVSAAVAWRAVMNDSERQYIREAGHEVRARLKAKIKTG